MIVRLVGWSVITFYKGERCHFHAPIGATHIMNKKYEFKTYTYLHKYDFFGASCMPEVKN